MISPDLHGPAGSMRILSGVPKTGFQDSWKKPIICLALIPVPFSFINKRPSLNLQPSSTIIEKSTLWPVMGCFQWALSTWITDHFGGKGSRVDLGHGTLRWLSSQTGHLYCLASSTIRGSVCRAFKALTSLSKLPCPVFLCNSAICFRHLSFSKSERGTKSSATWLRLRGSSPTVCFSHELHLSSLLGWQTKSHEHEKSWNMAHETPKPLPCISDIKPSWSKPSKKARHTRRPNSSV